jgi:hypothetical protein
MGPFIGKWLRLLERHIPMVQAGGAGSTGVQLAKRVLADQVVMFVHPSLLHVLKADRVGHHWD